jgi:hypothetical protein
MIQFNLLPDVKQQYIKSQRLKKTTVTIAVLAAGGALALVIMLAMVVLVFQKQHLKGLNDDIKENANKISKITDVEKVLTVQNQLNSLSDLHDKKPVASRLYEYIKQTVPANVSVSSLTVDFDNSAIKFTGSADALVSINKFVDTLKFTTYSLDNKPTENKAFTEVVLSSFSRNDKEATYNVDAKFDPVIFDTAQAVKLIVPNIISTRSTTEKPSNLFKEQAVPSNQGNQGE